MKKWNEFGGWNASWFYQKANLQVTEPKPGGVVLDPAVVFVPEAVIAPVVVIVRVAVIAPVVVIVPVKESYHQSIKQNC